MIQQHCHLKQHSSTQDYTKQVVHLSWCNHSKAYPNKAHHGSSHCNQNHVALNSSHIIYGGSQGRRIQPVQHTKSWWATWCSHCRQSFQSHGECDWPDIEECYYSFRDFNAQWFCRFILWLQSQWVQMTVLLPRWILSPSFHVYHKTQHQRQWGRPRQYHQSWVWSATYWMARSDWPRKCEFTSARFSLVVDEERWCTYKSSHRKSCHIKFTNVYFGER